MTANGKMLQSRPIARTIKETINRMLERTCAGIYLFSSFAPNKMCHSFDRSLVSNTH